MDDGVLRQLLLILSSLTGCDQLEIPDQPRDGVQMVCACDFDGDGIGEVEAPVVGWGQCKLNTATPTPAGVCS